MALQPARRTFLRNFMPRYCYAKALRKLVTFDHHVAGAIQHKPSLFFDRRRAYAVSASFAFTEAQYKAMPLGQEAFPVSPAHFNQRAPEAPGTAASREASRISSVKQPALPIF